MTYARRLMAGFTNSVAVVAGIAAMVLSCGDGAVEPAPPPPAAPVATTMTVNPASATLTALDETARFTVEVRDQNGQVMSGAGVAWASSDASVASVDASGLVTAVANGSATITATAGSISSSAAVTVAQEASVVTVSPDASVLSALGDTARLVAEGTDANGHGVAGSDFSWSSSATLVARVDASGLVTARANGAATITAISGSASGTASVTVAQVVSTVIVEPSRGGTVAVGDTLRLSAVGLDELNHDVPSAEFEWSSSDAELATVDGTGLVTGMTAGQVEITAAAGSVSETAIVAVTSTASSAPPTYVFAGDVPESARMRIRSGMEYARGYFADQHGVEATGFSVLVGDYESLRPVYERTTGKDFPLHPSSKANSTAWITQSLHGGAVVTLMIGLEEWALSSIGGYIVHEYFHVLQGQIAAGFEPVGNGETRWSHDAPKWMVEGHAVYAEYEYAPADFFDGHTPYADLGKGVISGELDPNDVTALLALDRYANCDWTSFTTYSLSFLATLFLSSQAPDGAYVAFWKLLPERATWEGAFREAFGLQYDDFEMAFEQWIVPQIPTYDQVRMRVLWPDRATDPENPLDAVNIGIDEPSWKEDEYGLLSTIAVDRPHGPLRPPVDFTITVPAGTVGNAVMSLWWYDEPTKEYLLGWYKGGELTDNREEATPFEFTGVSQSVEWELSAHPTTLPRLACRQRGYGRPCS